MLDIGVYEFVICFSQILEYLGIHNEDTLGIGTKPKHKIHYALYVQVEDKFFD